MTQYVRYGRLISIYAWNWPRKKQDCKRFNPLTEPSRIQTINRQGRSQNASKERVSTPGISLGRSKTAQDKNAQFPQWARDSNSVKRHTQGCVDNPMYPNDDWIGGIQVLGIKSTYRARIMDPAFKDMGLSASLKEWAVMMVEARYEFLATLDDVIKRKQL